MSIDAELAAAIALAETEAAARIAGAIGSAQIAAAATEQAAVTQAQADEQVATITSNAQKQIAVTRANADIQSTGISAVATEVVADTNRIGQEYCCDRELDGVRATQVGETDRLQRTLDFAEDKWRQIWPLISTYIQQNPNGGSGAITWQALIAALGAAPWISQGGVYTPSQVQQQKNALYARADGKCQTLLHDAQIDLAGRGFGGSSPLLDVLRFAYEAENIQTSTEGASQLALAAAKANAEEVLAQQTQRQAQYFHNERIFAELDKISVDLTTGIFGGVAQIISALAR